MLPIGGIYNMNEIYYFSGTGNSRFVADKIALKLENVSVKSISDLNDKVEASSKSVGFVFPVYVLGIPRIVENFLCSIDLSSAEYVYVVATMGGGYGNTFEQIKKIFKKRNISLSASFAVVMGSNSNLFIKTPGIDPMCDDSELESILRNALKEIDNIASTVKKREKVELEKPKFMIKLIGKLAYKAFFRKEIDIFDQKFHTKNCNNCGSCVESCPVNNIELNPEQEVIWKGQCEACLRCFNICPTESILYGEMDDDRMFKKYKKFIEVV